MARPAAIAGSGNMGGRNAQRLRHKLRRCDWAKPVELVGVRQAARLRRIS
jgi:hypothetical protein